MNIRRTHLTDEDAAIIKGMLWRGDRQHDIAACFGVNAGRIAEIASGQRFRHVAAKITDLPPSGPYNIHEMLQKQLVMIEKMQDLLLDAACRLDSMR